MKLLSHGEQSLFFPFQDVTKAFRTFRNASSNAVRQH